MAASRKLSSKSFIVRKRTLAVLAALAALLVIWHFARRHLRPALAGPDDATRAHLAHVKILRDTWGVPHIFGTTDADAAFGLAYAHAEDDFPTLQAVIAASRGKLGYVVFDKKAFAIDYYANLVRSEEKAAALYDSLSPQRARSWKATRAA